MRSQETEPWLYEDDEESGMVAIFWLYPEAKAGLGSDRMFIGDVYTTKQAEMIVSDHNKSLSPSTEQLLVEAKDMLVELRDYAGSLESFVRVHGGKGNVELLQEALRMLARVKKWCVTEHIEHGTATSWQWGECRVCLFTWQGMIPSHDPECPIGLTQVFLEPAHERR
jgi:hypothetical protein